ncbi:MAG TPA: glycosyltransferase family 4 protein [Polyangiaceae bacterium]
MRIAWVTPYLPEPAASGGAIRQQRLAAALAQTAEVHLFARGELWEWHRARSRELGFFAEHWVGRDYDLRSAFRTASALRGADLPSRVRRGSAVSLWRAIARAHARTPFHGVVVSHSWAALGARALGLPWLLDEHNVESRFFADLSRANGRGAQRIGDQLASFERWEREAWHDASALTCVSAEDAAFVAPHRSSQADSLRPPLVVHNGADLEQLALVPPSAREGGVLFVGSLHHAPNRAAALRLIEKIMPRVWQSLPRLPLKIVGGPVSLSLRRAALCASGPVLLLGRVADVGQHLASDRVFLNPLVHGAGSSLKTIEALAAGIPLISTELGARGFSLVPGEHYLRAESDLEFSNAVVHTVQGNAHGQSAALLGRAHAVQFGWRALGARFAAHALATFDRKRTATLS